MTPRHTVKLAALVASACLIVFAAQGQPAPAAPPDDNVLVHRFTIPPGQAWGTISVPLLPAAWRVGHIDGPGASEAHLRGMLDRLDGIEVGGRCTGWVEGARDYFCGFVVRGINVAGAGVGHLSFVSDWAAAPDAQRAQAAVQNVDHPMLLDVSRLARFRAPPPDAGHTSFGRELQFEIRAVSDPLVPSEFDRGSGMVILRGGQRGAAN
jgi:hypothetical protein